MEQTVWDGWENDEKTVASDSLAHMVEYVCSRRTHRIPKPEVRTASIVLKRIRELTPTHTDAETAVCLNAEDLQTAHGQPFTKQRVHSLRRTHRIVKVQRGRSLAGGA